MPGTTGFLIVKDNTNVANLPCVPQDVCSSLHDAEVGAMVVVRVVLCEDG